MTYKYTGRTVGVQPITETSAVARHSVGMRVKGMDDTGYGEGEFIYGIGVASTIVGSVVFLSKDTGQTALAAAAGGQGDLALAMSINLAGFYGWYQIFGKGVAKVLAAFADDGQCYLTSTLGSIDDADVSGDLIVGMKGASAIDTPTTGFAEVELSYPVVAGVAD